MQKSSVSDTKKPNGKRGYFQCSQIHNAIQAVLQGRMTVEKSSAVFQVPKSTIYRRIQAINTEWDTYNHIVQSSSTAYYPSSNTSHPSTSQVYYVEDINDPVYLNSGEHEVLTVSKGPLRLRRRAIKPVPAYKKAPLKTLISKPRRKTNPLLLGVNEETVFMNDHAYSMPREQAYESYPNQISQEEPASDSPPPPLLYMGDEEGELVEEELLIDEEVELIDEEHLVEQNLLVDEEIEVGDDESRVRYAQEAGIIDPANLSNPDGPLPRAIGLPKQIRLVNDKGQCIRVLEIVSEQEA